MERKMKCPICIFLLSLLLLSQKALPQPADSAWPMFLHDVQHTGRSAHVGPDSVALVWTFSTAADGTLGWANDITWGWIHLSPTIGADGTIYLPYDQTLYATNPDGSDRWHLNLKQSIKGPAILDAQGIMYCTSYGKLFAVTPEGKIKWQIESDNDFTTSPCISRDGFIYVGTKAGLAAFGNVSPGGTPDLAISQMTLDPPMFGTPGVKYQIKAEIKDLTNSASAHCKVSFYIDNFENLLDSTTIFVPAGSPGYAIGTWNTQNYDVREYTIFARISHSTPEESDTTNNVSQIQNTLLPFLQDRIASAQPGDTLWVDPGLYFENITLKNDLVVKSRHGPEVTIIDGRGAAVVVDAANLNRSAVLEGFTIRNGKGSILTGGGINLDLSAATIKNNIIRGNDPYGIHHRGFQSAWVEHNLIIGSTGSFGYGIYANNSQAVFINNTIIGNQEGIHAIGFYVPSPTIVNCILWNNGEDLTYSARATYSDIEDGDTGFGNISLDPQFVDPQNDDYHLQLSSPCLDAGDPTILDPDGTRSDMGAYPVFQGGGRFGAPQNLQAELIQFRNALAVELSWEGPPPVLEVSVNRLYFDTYDLGWAFSLKNSGLGRLTWTAGSDVNWLQLIPEDGVALLGTGQLIAFANRGTLPVGEYNGNIIITSNGGDKTIPVTLKVGPTPIPGSWRGSGISFHVSESMQRVSSLVFTKSSGNQNFRFEFNGSVPIDSTQSFSIISGNITITGTFTSRSTATGTYSIPFDPSPSGNWSASWSSSALAKNGATSKLTGYIDPETQVIGGYNIYRSMASGSYDHVFAAVSGNDFTYMDSSVVADSTYYYIVKAVDQHGSLSAPTNEVSAQIVSTEVRDATMLPTTFALYQNYPNPFNPETTIRYQLPKATEVKLEIYNLLGQRVATLVDAKQPAGYYSVKWDGTDHFGHSLASGVYVYRLHAGEFLKVRKLTLLR